MPDSSSDIAHEAKGAAVEAQGAVRSLDRLMSHKFNSLEQSISSVHQELAKLEGKLNDACKINDNKFWSLAIAVIAILVGVCGWFISFYVNNVASLKSHG